MFPSRALNACRRSLLLQKRSHVLSSSRFASTSTTEARLEETGLTLPPPGKPKANYGMVTWDGNLIYLSGHLPIDAKGSLTIGKLGRELDTKKGYDTAQLVGLNLLSTLKNELGDLDRVEKVIKIFGIVNSEANFTEQHLVMNGASDLLIKVFGNEVGYHSRSSIGANALPLNAAVEIECIVRVKA